LTSEKHPASPVVVGAGPIQVAGSEACDDKNQYSTCQKLHDEFIGTIAPTHFSPVPHRAQRVVRARNGLMVR
jgi:hypothetical protein